VEISARYLALKRKLVDWVNRRKLITEKEDKLSDWQKKIAELLARTHHVSCLKNDYKSRLVGL
jgi:hypothetical protein